MVSSFDKRSVFIFDQLTSLSLFQCIFFRLIFRPVIVLYNESSINKNTLSKIFTWLRLKQEKIHDIYMMDTPYKKDDFIAEQVSKSKLLDPIINPLLKRYQRQLMEYDPNEVKLCLSQRLSSILYNNLSLINFANMISDKYHKKKRLILFLNNSKVTKKFVHMHNTLNCNALLVELLTLPKQPFMFLVTLSKYITSLAIFMRSKSCTKKALAAGVFSVNGFCYSGKKYNNKGSTSATFNSSFSDYDCIPMNAEDFDSYYIFERSDFFNSGEITNALNELNITPVDLNRNRLLHYFISRIPVTRSSLKMYGKATFEILNAILANLYTLNYDKRFFLSSYFELKYYTLWYKLILEYYNIVLIHHFQQCSSDYISLACGNDRIRIGNQRSYYLPSFCAKRADDVMFVWGEYSAEVFRNSGSISKYILISGVQVSCQNSEKVYNRLESTIKSDMIRSGAKNFITIYDSSTQIDNFYQFILSWIVEDPTLGCFLKPKSNCIEKFYDQNLLQKAINTKRFAILNTDVSIEVASKLSEFSIGVVTRSAIMCAATYGSKIVYLDYGYSGKGKLKDNCLLYSLGVGRCLFFDHNMMKAALKSYFFDPIISPRLGDVSPIIDLIDPFRDGNSIKRMQNFTNMYMKLRMKNCASEAALEKSVRAYAAEWGDDKIYIHDKVNSYKELMTLRT